MLTILEMRRVFIFLSLIEIFIEIILRQKEIINFKYINYLHILQSLNEFFWACLYTKLLFSKFTREKVVDQEEET